MVYGIDKTYKNMKEKKMGMAKMSSERSDCLQVGQSVICISIRETQKKVCLTMQLLK